MLNRNTYNRLQANHDNQENLQKKQIAFFFYILSLIILSLILPTPLYFFLCGVAVIGTIVLHVFPELDEKLGRAVDWLSEKWSQLMSNNREPPAQELLTSIDSSLIHRRLSQQSVDSAHTDNSTHYYDEDVVQYAPLFAELLDIIDLPRPSVSFSNVRRSNQRYC